MNHKILKDFATLVCVIPYVTFLCLAFFFPYLVGQHYPFDQQMAGEKLVFIILFPMTWVVGFIACWIWSKVEFLKGPPPMVNQLVELNEIIYPDSNYIYDFPWLKQEVQRLKSLRLKELESQLETKKKDN